MATSKLSISLDRQLAQDAREAAAQDGVSLSAFIGEAVDIAMRLREGQKGVAEFEAEFGAFTAAEKAEAARVADELGVGVRRR